MAFPRLLLRVAVAHQPPVRLLIRTATEYATFQTFGIDVIYAVPFPLSVMLRQINIPNRVESSESYGVRGVSPPESEFDPITIQFDGLISVDAPEDFRDAMTNILAWLDDAVYLQVWPGRSCKGYIKDHTLDPHWYGASDTLAQFSFTVIVPDGVFFDGDNNTYRTP